MRETLRYTVNDLEPRHHDFRYISVLGRTRVKLFLLGFLIASSSNALKGLLDLLLAAVLTAGEELESDRKAVLGDGIGFNSLAQLLTRVGQVVDVGAGKLDVPLGGSQGVDACELLEPLGSRDGVLVDVLGLGDTLARLLGTVVLELGELVQDGMGNGGGVAAELASSHGLLGGDEAGVLDQGLLTAGLLVQALVGLDDVEHSGAVGMLCGGVLDIGPEAEVVVSLGLCEDLSARVA